ncbi:MAG: ferrous iron transport protein A [Methanospirillaceae archaeon]|nr:ferrous iron transport protein A [Methanospirillaceae archaeon]
MNAFITELEKGVSGKIIGLQGGCGFVNQLRSMGIREGKIISIVTIHPFRGPVVVRLDGKLITLGRGFANRIIVEL